jgi:tetratricopeptide (TPR) repeat protein
MAESDSPQPSKRPRRQPSVPRTPDALDIALDRADDDDAARALLAKHTELLNAQIASERLDHGAKRMMMAVRLFIALAALGLAGGLTWMILSAQADHGLVVEAFATPPDLATRGLTGEVLAGNLADRLGDIDRSARSFRAPETMSVNWGDDIKIEIPSTGVSIGELDRFLRRRLGHQTVIGGSVFRSPQGLRMTVRTGALGTVEQTGQDAQIEAMVQKAAEGVFEKTQPYRFSKYLEFSGRLDEAMAVARRDAESDDPKERAWAWAQISNLFDRVGNEVAGAAAGKRAIANDPHNALAYLNTANAFARLSHDAEAAAYLKPAAEIGSTEAGGLSEVGRNTSLGNLSALPATVGDFQGALEVLDRLNGPGYAGTRELNDATRATLLTALHDIHGSHAASHPPPDTYFITHYGANGGISTPQYVEAVQMEDWPRALRQTQAMIAALAPQPEGKAITQIALQRQVLPLHVQALAANGRIKEAQALAAALPLDCANCATAKMTVAGLARDYPAAFHWLVETKRWGAVSPFPETTLGQILLKQGKFDTALQLADRALQSGPKFPDAFKLKGDALRKLNRVDEAVGWYSKAAQAAPRWGRLQIDWGFAEMRRGRWDDARKHLAAAAAMDLNPADRRLLERLNGIAASR